ncbi:MAG: TetR/AcrR family transcriptional regulator [Pseudomonadota bacterium]
MRAKGNEPRDRLIAIALEMLDKDHPEDLSLREVARRAGLTSGAPAHHFGNKLGLLVACAEVAWADLGSAMEVTDPDIAPRDAMLAKTRAYVDYALSRPGPYQLLMSRRFVDKSETTALTEWRFRTMEGVSAQIERAVGPVSDPKFFIRRGMAMWSLLHGFVTLHQNKAVSADMHDDMVREICDMAVRVALAPPDA